jgi:2-polyprenyl-3-methyl-5-hydroxy-6-metoxy-1,4-benzoquinol methylase
MTSPYPSGPITDLWNRCLDPEGKGLMNAVADDIASYTGESREAALAKMRTGLDDLRRLWEERRIDLADPKSIEAFYHEQFVEAYELAHWHAGGTPDGIPLNYGRAALFARTEGCRRVLDFGSGIGSGALCFASLGCEVDVADVARKLLDFVGHRLMRHGRRARAIDLSRGELPDRGAYDLITCFDVLEHVPDQLGKLRELESYLRPGGRLFVNFMDDSTDEQRPMHVSSAENWLALVRRTALRPDWPWFAGGLQVVRRARVGRIWNALARVVDRAQGR